MPLSKVWFSPCQFTQNSYILHKFFLVNSYTEFHENLSNCSIIDIIKTALFIFSLQKLLASLLIKLANTVASATYHQQTPLGTINREKIIY
jgi:hypothetical protein